MIRILFNKIGQIGVVIFSFLSLVFFFRNKSLSRENNELKKASMNLRKTIEIKEKVIDVRKNNKPTDIDGNLERMRQEKL